MCHGAAAACMQAATENLKTENRLFGMAAMHAGFT